MSTVIYRDPSCHRHRLAGVSFVSNTGGVNAYWGACSSNGKYLAYAMNWVDGGNIKLSSDYGYNMKNLYPVYNASNTST